MMHSKLLGRAGYGLVLLVVLMLCFDVVYVDGQVTTTANPTTTTRRKRVDKDDSYGQDFVGYGDDDGRYDDNYDSYENKRRKKPTIGGADPRPYGQDLADDKKIYDDKDSMLVALDVWITEAKNWEQKKKYRYGGRDRDNYQGDKYKKNNNYKDKDDKNKKYKPEKYKKDKDDDYKRKDNNSDDDDDDKDDYKRKDYGKQDKYRKKRSYKRVRFPVRHYKDVRRFPLRRFPPLFSTLPWLPIFYDRVTYQTFIFSPTGGIYVLPPLINFYGQRFAVAQLIKWGYASLVSTGVPPPPNFDVAPIIQPGLTAGGGVPPPPTLGFNANNGQFNGGVPTNFPSFQPRSAQVVRED